MLNDKAHCKIPKYNVYKKIDTIENISKKTSKLFPWEKNLKDLKKMISKYFLVVSTYLQ